MKIKITAVNYLNVLPFKYGIEQSTSIQKWAEINYASPFECAEMIVNNQTNIALAPVAVLAVCPHLKIITDYCLSTYDAVKSVKLYSTKDIKDIQSVILDYQSLSSISLLKVLMKYYWKKEVQYIKGYKEFEKEMKADAMVVIGDRTFQLNGKFNYEYDLATEWFKFYGKPFVFAAWISNINLNEEQLNDLNTAFDFGLKNINNIIEDVLQHTHVLDFLNIQQRKKLITQYLKINMKYHLTEDRRKSIEHFLNLLKTILNKNVLVT